MNKPREKKLIVEEALHCVECGAAFSRDVPWSRELEIKLRRLRIRSSALLSEHFHSLCGKHKLKFFGEEIANAYFRRFIDDRDIEKMGVALEALEKFRRGDAHEIRREEDKRGEAGSLEESQL